VSESMMAQTAEAESEVQRRYLQAVLELVRYALRMHCRRQGQGRQPIAEALEPLETLQQRLDEAVAAMTVPSPLEHLCRAFRLSPFERDLLVLCAGVELDSSFAGLCAQAMGQAAGERSLAALPTFSLALAALPQAHWDAITPQGPLRHWHLLTLGNAATLTMSPLRLDEPILHYLVGLPYRDERLRGLQPLPPPRGELLPSQRAPFERLLAAWAGAAQRSRLLSLAASQTAASLPPLLLSGSEERLQLAARACAHLGLHLCLLSAAALPTGASDLDLLARLWEREALLNGSALLIECEEGGIDERASLRSLERFASLVRTPLIVSCRERRPLRLQGGRAPVSIEIAAPGNAEQQQLWRVALGERSADLNGHVEQLAMQFRLSSAAIEVACSQLPPLAASAPADELAHQLWEACRLQARPALEDLAQRIESQATWEQLVLPEEQIRLLHEIVIHVRRRTTVYETWGFGHQGGRGLGISALFAGSSGTGKTLAAEVLAHELRLDLYRIDLSAVVSKYIGETEKNLRRIFDAAEAGGAILLFDEADALFGKRSEVKDSHDRYANIEVSYLLQRMEAYRGLAILTTNLKHALDTAFLRRIRFIVQFPFPDAAMRAEIWRRIFPAALPREGLDVEKLARLHVAGGNIRNIALHAAFLAADAAEPLRMSHLLRAAAAEYAKLEKPLTEAEIGGWL
jgi:hypothetical protein